MNHIDNNSPSSSSNEIQRNERIVSIRSSSNRSNNVATTTNDEIAIYTSGNSNMEQSTPNSYRVSPYDTIISETLLDDDRTIDAAVVEAILEDNTPPVNQQSSPATLASSSSHDPNDTRPNRITTNISAEAQLIPMAISNQDHIPEVQPEVDIEEVHVQQHDRHAMSTISALTTNTTSIDQRDTKQPPSSTPRVAAAIVNDDNEEEEQRQLPNHVLPYPPIHPPYPAVLSSSAFAVLPPIIPQRHTLVSNVRGYSTGTTTTTSPSIPMFQSTTMMTRHSSSDHTPHSSSNESRRRRSQQQQHLVEELPDYKDQARSILPHRVPMNTRNESGGGSDTNTPNSNTQNSSSGGGSHHYNNSSSGQTSQSHLHSDDEHIPVVAAILVPAERLAAEERLEEQWIQQQQQQNRYTTYAEGGGMEPQRYQPSNSNLSSAESTLTTSQSSNSNSNNNNHNNLTTQSGESHVASHSQRSKENSDNIDINSMSERRFWMTIILTALILNSMLVAGAVVGGFCAAGKCSTTGSSSNSVTAPPTLEINNTTTNIPVPAAVPSLIPLLSPSPSATRYLSQNPSLVNPDATIDRVPVPTPVPVPVPIADNVAVVSPTLSSFLNTPYPTVTDHPTPATGAFPTLFPTTSIDISPVDEGVSNNFTIGTTETEPPEDTDDALKDSTDAPKTVPDSGKTVEVGTLSPTMTPSMINITGDNNFGNESVGSITEESHKGIRFVVLIPILVGMELMIVVGLVLFYRHWKQNQRPKQVSIRDTSHYDTAPSSPATNHTSTSSSSSSSSSSEEQMVPPESSPRTNTIDHRSDRYMDQRGSGPLSTIEERSVLFEV